MYNNKALACSQAALESQMKFTMESLPFLRQVIPTDSNVAMKRDYFYECDAVGVGIDNHNYNLQYKVRPNHTDFVLIAKRLSGSAAMNNDSIGFYYRGEKYTFCPLYDYLIERIKGVDFIISREQIHSMELLWPKDLEGAISYVEEKTIAADDGTSIPTGQYYIYIPLKNIAKIHAYLLQINNPNLSFADILNRQAEHAS